RQEADRARRPHSSSAADRRMGSRGRGTGSRTRAGARARDDVSHMIACRQVDARYPFAWEDASQPAGRWHGDGEGPAHYFADTPDGAWAGFLRHEEIPEPEDLLTIRRRMWSVEIGDPPVEQVVLPIDTLTGDP